MRYLKEYLYFVFDEHIIVKDNIPRDYALDIAVAAFSETVRWWLKSHSDYTPEEISRFYFESVDI